MYHLFLYVYTYTCICGIVHCVYTHTCVCMGGGKERTTTQSVFYRAVQQCVAGFVYVTCSAEAQNTHRWLRKHIDLPPGLEKAQPPQKGVFSFAKHSSRSAAGLHLGSSISNSFKQDTVDSK